MTYEYTDAEGKVRYRLPDIYLNTTPVTWEFLESHGWKRREVVPDPVLPGPDRERRPGETVSYSKLKVIDKLAFLGLWKQVEKMLRSGDGMAFVRFTQCNELRTDYPLFVEMAEKVGRILPEGMTAADFLAGCETEDSTADGEEHHHAH